MPENDLKNLYSTLYQKESPPQNLSNKRTGIIRLVVIAAILIALPLSVFFVLRQQDIRQRASQVPPSTITKMPVKTIAFLGKTAITEKDIDTEMKSKWGPYYKDVQNNKTIRQNTLKQIIERKIVQEDSQKLSIKTSSQQDQAKEKEDLIVSLAQEVLTWKKVETVSVFKDPQSPTFTQNVAKAKASMERIRAFLSEGNSLEKSFSLAQKEAGFDTFISFEPARFVYDDTKWGKTFLSAIELTPKGSYTQVILSPGGTLMVASIIDEQKTDYATMEDYLAARKKEVVTTP